jgi:hypothetical protein
MKMFRHPIAGDGYCKRQLEKHMAERGKAGLVLQK